MLTSVDNALRFRLELDPAKIPSRDSIPKEVSPKLNPYPPRGIYKVPRSLGLKLLCENKATGSWLELPVPSIWASKQCSGMRIGDG